jgi:hypothetical protein
VILPLSLQRLPLLSPGPHLSPWLSAGDTSLEEPRPILVACRLRSAPLPASATSLPFYDVPSLPLRRKPESHPNPFPPVPIFDFRPGLSSLARTRDRPKGPSPYTSFFPFSPLHTLSQLSAHTTHLVQPTLTLPTPSRLYPRHALQVASAERDGTTTDRRTQPRQPFRLGTPDSGMPQGTLLDNASPMAGAKEAMLARVEKKTGPNPAFPPSGDEAKTIQNEKQTRQSARSFDYLWRSGVAGGLAGCAVRSLRTLHLKSATTC